MKIFLFIGIYYLVCSNEFKMYTINVAKIIETRGLDSFQTASLLFPSNKHPQKALDRVIEGKSKLDSEQVAFLADLAGIPISTLYTQEGWSCRSRGHVHTMTNGKYTAFIHMDIGLLRIQIGSKRITTGLLSKSIELGELIETINNIIHKNETKN